MAGGFDGGGVHGDTLLGEDGDVVEVFVRGVVVVVVVFVVGGGVGDQVLVSGDLDFWGFFWDVRLMDDATTNAVVVGLGLGQGGEVGGTGLLDFRGVDGKF